jgi:hypothetical protein
MSIKRDLVMLNANAYASEYNFEHSAPVRRPIYNCRTSKFI